MAIALPVKIYSLTFENTRNGLFEGFFYIALGMYFGMNSESLIEIDVSGILAAIAIGVLGCFLISSDQHLLFCALVAGGIVLLSIRGGGSEPTSDLCSNAESKYCHLPHPYVVRGFICLWYLRKQAI